MFAEVHSQIPCSHKIEFGSVFHRLYELLSNSHLPVPIWDFFRALAWLREGSGADNHFRTAFPDRKK